jgi:hypothetical protein
MKNKLKLNTIWSVIIIILLIVGIYFLLHNNKKVDEKVQINNKTETMDLANNEINPVSITSNNIIDSSYDWNSVSESELNNVIIKDSDLYERLSLRYNEHVGLDIENKKEIDLKGDGKKDLLIERTGPSAGIYFIFTRNDEGVISIAKQKDKDGKISSILLGGGYGPDIQSTYELIPQEHGYYITNISIKSPASGFGVADYSCSSDSVNGYTWNSEKNLFEWNKTLSNKYFLYVKKTYNLNCSGKYISNYER